MTDMFRVLVVEESPREGRRIRAILNNDPGLRVTGEARTGEEALALSQRLKPDVIVMDVNIQGKDACRTTRGIMSEAPTPIVLLTNGNSNFEAEVGREALNAGALMLAVKPKEMSESNHEAVNLISLVRAMADVTVIRRIYDPVRQGVTSSPEGMTSRESISAPARLVAIGVSTGGPPALDTLFSRLPADFQAPVVVVQHMSRGFIGGLVNWLDNRVSLRVKLAQDGQSLLPGTIYVAPDDFHLLVLPNGLVGLKSSPPVGSHRPSVTTLFESVAGSYGSSTVGVIMTGMGGDGAQGLKTLYDAGGHTIAQDEASCAIFGMPKVAIGLGAAREVLPLEGIADRLVELVGTRVGITG